MNKKKKIILVLIIFIASILFLFKNRIMELYTLVSDLLAKFEGFSAKPYWDVRQWTWGYGTRVPDKFMKDGRPIPGATINKIDAMIDAWAHIQASRSYLQTLINITLTPNQWAALLSFAYNEGDHNADNLVANINSKSWYSLENQWKLYTKVRDRDGVYYVSKNLVTRRAAEWDLFNSGITSKI